MDGREALQAFEGPTWPDLVFLDYYLPEGETGTLVLKLTRRALLAMQRADGMRAAKGWHVRHMLPAAAQALCG